MPTLKTLDEAARLSHVSRRLLTKWVSQGKLTAYRIAGDRHRYVDMDELKRVRKPERVSPPEDEP